MTEESKNVMKVCSTLKRICATIDELTLFFLMNRRSLPQDVLIDNTDLLAELEIRIDLDATEAKQILERIIQMETDKNKERSQEATKFIRRLSRLEAEIKMIS